MYCAAATLRQSCDPKQRIQKAYESLRTPLQVVPLCLRALRLLTCCDVLCNAVQTEPSDSGLLLGAMYVVTRCSLFFK